MATRNPPRPVRASPGTITHDGRPMKYAHGQHAAYVLDRCHCPDCRASNKTYEKARAQRLVPPFVLANQAREHIAWLATQGIGRKQIAKVSGVAHGTLCKIVYGDSQRGSGPSKRIRPETHDAIMAVTPADCGGNLKVIDAAPTWALLDEMIAAGIPKSEIGRALGTIGPGLQIKRTTVSPANRDKVKALHADWVSGYWLPVKRDRWGNANPKPAPRRVAVTREQRIEAYDDRADLINALAEAVEVRLERPWRGSAACRGLPPRMWFPQRGDVQTHKAAVKVCKSCTVRRDCLMANLHETDGIYGGMGPLARRRLRLEIVGEAA